MKIPKESLRKYCERIIETNGNPSTKDAEEHGIPFGYWFEMTTRVSSEQLVKNAKKVLAKLNGNQ